jgi:adenylate cyclase
MPVRDYSHGVTALTQQQLSELVPCAAGDVERLQQLGLVTPDEHGLFPPSDVHVVRLMGAFEAAGISLEAVAKGVTGGEFSFPMGLFLPEPAPRLETYEELGARLERAPELLRRLSRELGLPPAADDRVRVEDAEILSLLVTTLDLADEDEFSRFARLYGGTVQRLVGAGLQFFDAAVRQRIETYDLPYAERDDMVYERAAAYTELVSAIVPWLQRRHRERSVLDYIVGVTEEFMETSGLMPAHPKQPPAIVFLDLAGYTAFAEERGDEAAAGVAADLAGMVQETAQTHGGRPVKWLGDGVMFHFNDPGKAIASGLDLVERAVSATSVPARIGINAGAVIAQEGDYFGRTVNVASRIADYAQPHEVLVSEEAMRNADVPEVEFELVGDIVLKGLSRAVRLHRVTRAAP